jgi:hypothetical protein
MLSNRDLATLILEKPSYITMTISLNGPLEGEPRVCLEPAEKEEPQCAGECHRPRVDDSLPTPFTGFDARPKTPSAAMISAASPP